MLVNLKDQDLSELKSLTIYRKILEDEVISAMLNEDLYEFNFRLIEKAHSLALKGNVFRQYCIHLFLQNENVFSLACEKHQNIENSTLYNYALKDVEILQCICECNSYTFYPIEDKNLPTSIQKLEEAPSAKDKIMLLIEYYKNHGAGDMSLYSMFSLSETGELKGISRPDMVDFEDIIGCENQKTSLIENTEAFLAGKPANNVLLVGSRGSGKSSCIKAVINRYHNKNLRLIEVQKEQAGLLPNLVEKLAERGKYFIIYMDDLSYEQNEPQYKHLKSILEGGAGVKPPNVLFYATGNRRHIIRESWNDRNSDDEIHINDTINEKVSLSDRFGLTLHFPHINQEEYLNIITGLVKRSTNFTTTKNDNEHKADVDLKTLHAQSLQWVVEQNRMSGRTAVQFLHHVGIL